MIEWLPPAGSSRKVWWSEISVRSGLRVKNIIGRENTLYKELGIGTDWYGNKRKGQCHLNCNERGRENREKSGLD